MNEIFAAWITNFTPEYLIGFLGFLPFFSIFAIIFDRFIKVD